MLTLKEVEDTKIENGPSNGGRNTYFLNAKRAYNNLLYIKTNYWN